jgi:hypothetical protein
VSNPLLAVEYPERFAPSHSQKTRATQSWSARVPQVSYNLVKKTANSGALDALLAWPRQQKHHGQLLFYSLLKEDTEFRKKIAEQVGIGFQIPTEKLDVAPTQGDLHPHDEVVNSAVSR